MISNSVQNVRDFGAIADGKSNDTQAIREAIDHCVERGGGTVYFPPGAYRSATIHLHSNMTLYADSGATTLFSDDFDDYPPVRTRWEGIECYGFSPLIYGFELENVSIVGRGTLDGQGRRWWEKLRSRRATGRIRPETRWEKELARMNQAYETAGSGGGGREMQFLRPPLIQLMGCRNVSIRDVTCTNSPFWNTHLVCCDDAVIEGVRFRNPKNAPNTDGLDLDSCSNVRVSNCLFDVGDDCLCLKAGIGEDGRKAGRPTENITVTNCTMLQGHGGVVFGSETAGGIRDVSVSNCIFEGTDRGIRIKSRRNRGGVVEDIHFSDIIMKNVLCPFVINMFYRCGSKPEEDWLFTETPQPISETTPQVRGLSLANITDRQVRAAAGFIYGLPERPVQNLRLINVSIEVEPDAQQTARDAAMIRGIDPGPRKGLVGKYISQMLVSGVQVTGAGDRPLLLENSEGVTVC
jgi:polygalacturonase